MRTKNIIRDIEKRKKLNFTAAIKKFAFRSCRKSEREGKETFKIHCRPS